MPIELAVPEPVEGAGLLLTAIESFSKVQAAMTPAWAAGTDAAISVARAHSLMVEIVIT
jgi:hypothetical protein